MPERVESPSQKEVALSKNFFVMDIYTIPKEEKSQIMASKASFDLTLMKRRFEIDNVSWQQAHKEYQNFLQNRVKTPNEKVLFSQRIANYMLRNTSILIDAPSLEKQQTIYFYINLLKEAKSSDAELFYAGLENLTTFLNKEQLKGVAQYVINRQDEVEEEKIKAQVPVEPQTYKLNPSNNVKQDKLASEMVHKMESQRDEAKNRRNTALERLKKFL